MWFKIMQFLILNIVQIYNALTELEIEELSFIDPMKKTLQYC